MAHRRRAYRLEFGWREAPIADDPGRRYVETYCYAFAANDFLENEWRQLYWRTAIVQMTRYYVIEAARSGIRLSSRGARFPVWMGSQAGNRRWLR